LDHLVSSVEARLNTFFLLIGLVLIISAALKAEVVVVIGRDLVVKIVSATFGRLRDLRHLKLVFLLDGRGSRSSFVSRHEGFQYLYNDRFLVCRSRHPRSLG
jgi:hypothetical protein